jgi:hypothetical protein
LRTTAAAALGCAALLAAAPPARAWNDHGHMTIAAAAYGKLRPAVRAKVDKLLALNPDYAGWVARVAPARRGLVAFVMASTWPDAIKHDGKHTNDGEHPRGPAASRNVGYGDELQHRYWHYVDVPFSPDGTATTPAAAPNAETQIAAFRTVLASATASDELKSYDLVWLLHLVGDVHQPLHATSRFDHAQPDGDQGGNLVALCAAPCKDALHGLWDGILGSSVDPRAATEAASRLPAPDAKAARVGDEHVWIEESFEAAQAHAYLDPPIGVGAGPFTVDAKYKTQAHALAQARAALAAARLANLLNEALR